MKKLLSLVIISGFLFSCVQRPKDGQSATLTEEGIEVTTDSLQKYQREIIPYSDTKRGISVVVVDSCEYVYCETSGVEIIHKQNCRFCRERNQP